MAERLHVTKDRKRKDFSSLPKAEKISKPLYTQGRLRVIQDGGGLLQGTRFPQIDVMLTIILEPISITKLAK